jgi:hypothetical protein
VSSEDSLQQLAVALLARDWPLVVREIQVHVYRADIVAWNPEADRVLAVEVKLKANREVIEQAAWHVRWADQVAALVPNVVHAARLVHLRDALSEDPDIGHIGILYPDAEGTQLLTPPGGQPLLKSEYHPRPCYRQRILAQAKAYHDRDTQAHPPCMEWTCLCSPRGQHRCLIERPGVGYDAVGGAVCANFLSPGELHVLRGIPWGQWQAGKREAVNAIMASDCAAREFVKRELMGSVAVRGLALHPAEA